MTDNPNVVLRGGPGDGQISYVPVLGDPMPFEDVGGGSVTYVDSDELEEHGGIQLRVYVLKVGSPSAAGRYRRERDRGYRTVPP